MKEPPPKCLPCQKEMFMKKKESLPRSLPLFTCRNKKCNGWNISAKDARAWRIQKEAKILTNQDDLLASTQSFLHVEATLMKCGWNPQVRCKNKECIEFVNQHRDKYDEINYGPRVICTKIKNENTTNKTSN